jgi:hypothetical protein
LYLNYIGYTGHIQSSKDTFGKPYSEITAQLSPPRQRRPASTGTADQFLTTKDLDFAYTLNLPEEKISSPSHTGAVPGYTGYIPKYDKVVLAGD